MAKKAKAKVSVAEKSEKGRQPNDEMRGRMVTVGFPLWQQTGRKRHLQFKAGKMYVIDNMVHPDPRKGYVCIDQDEDHVMHFCWMERDAVGIKEVDLTPEPYDSIFKRVQKCTTGRVYILKIRSTSKNYFFWMQESSAEKDSEVCAKVNYLLNFPPVWLRFPQIAWNLEMPRSEQSSEYDSAESDISELQTMNEGENNPTVSERLRDQLPSLLRAYKATVAGRPNALEDSFPQPVVGNVSLLAQLEGLLPNLDAGTRNSSENSFESSVVDEMRAITATVNGGPGERLQILGFIDGDVSDLESDSEYSDILDTGSLETNVNGKSPTNETGPSRVHEPWDLKVGETRVVGIDEEEIHRETTATERTKPETGMVNGLEWSVAYDREASSEATTSDLNVLRESESDALDKWESTTEPIFVLQRRIPGLIGSNAPGIDTGNGREPEKGENLIDGETAAMAEGWQTARSSTVDTSLVGSEISSRGFVLSDCWAGSEESLWKSATDPVGQPSSQVASSSTTVDGKATTTKELEKRLSSEHLADNDGSLDKTQDDDNSNVVALCVEVAKEGTVKEYSEGGEEPLIADAKNETEVSQITESIDRSEETIQTETSSNKRMLEGLFYESQDVSDETESEAQSSKPQRTDGSGKEESKPPSVDSNLSNEQLPSTLKRILEIPECSGNQTSFEFHGVDPKSYETALSVFSTSPESGSHDGGCITQGYDKLSESETLIKGKQDGESAEDGTFLDGSDTNNITMVVLAPSVGSESTNQVGNQPKSSKIDVSPQSTDGTVNHSKACGSMDDGNQATTSKSSQIGTAASSEREQAHDQTFQNDNPDTQTASRSVLCGTQGPETKSVLLTVSKSLEEVIHVSGPTQEPRYNLRKRPRPIRPSQSGPAMCPGEGRKGGAWKKPRTSSPGVPLPAPFRVQDASPSRSSRAGHPRVSSVNLLSSPNQKEWGNGRSRKRANEDEPSDGDLEGPPNKKAKSDGSNSAVGPQSSSSVEHELLSSAGGSKGPLGVPRKGSAKTGGQQTEPVKIRQIKKTGPETTVRTRVTPQVQPPPVNRARRDRSQNTKPVIIEDRSGSKPKSKNLKPSESDRRPKP